jgi:Protein of unknown function (DUF4012)
VVAVCLLLLLLVAAPVAAAPGARAIQANLTADLVVAQGDLEQGLKQLETGYKNQDATQVEAASASFARSRDRLRAMAHRMQPLDFGRSGAMPSAVRSRMTTLDAVIDMAAHVDAAGVIGAEALLKSGMVGGAAAGQPVAIAQLTDLLGSIRAELGLADRSAAGIDASVLPASQRGSLTKALAELRAAVTGLDALWPSLDAVLDLLGMNGPRTYLIEQVNPAELRSGGGFIGTVSLVHADRGRVTLTRSLPVEAFDYCDANACVHPRPKPWQPGYVAPPAELTGAPLPTFSRVTAWSLEDSGFAPDFATNAAVAEMFARRELSTPIDGVVAVDYYAVAPLLQLTGPISLPQYRLTLTEANFVDAVVTLDLNRDPAHKDVIAAAAAQIVASLSHLPPNGLGKLVGIVQDMIRGRHLQVHFDDAGVQQQAGRLGFSELLNPRHDADFLLETEDNYGGSKANYFIQRSFQLDLSHTGPLLQHRLTVTLHDGAPPDRPYDGPQYYAYLRITVPANATHVSVTSARSAEYAPIEPPARRTQTPPAGSQVAGGWIFVLVGSGLSGDYQATFSWDTPWTPAAGGSPVLYWQKQPGTVQDPVKVTWSDGGASASTTSDLSQDRLVTLGPNRVQVAPVSLAS